MTRSISAWAPVLAFVVNASCTIVQQAPGPAGPQPPPPPPALVSRTVLPDGDYGCTITSGQYSYKPYLCRVTTHDGVTTLEKLEGSQRIRGTVAFGTDDGFRFNGQFYCNGGGCERPVDAAFARQGDATWGAGIGNDDSIQLVYMPGGMYAGASYGGAGYGGAIYGGAIYGGAGYGGAIYGGAIYGGAQYGGARIGH